MERRKFTREFKLEAVRLIRERGVSYTQASQDLGVHQSQLRDWAKKFAEDPQHSFPGHGQMKPEQEEIAQLKREVAKLKAERDILKNCHGLLSRTVVRLRAVETVRANLAPWRVAAVSLLEAQSPLKNVVHGWMRT